VSHAALAPRVSRVALQAVLEQPALDLVLAQPQGIGFAPESNRLAVANDGDGSCRLYAGTSLQDRGRRS
jgi:hypothetical protein